MGTSVSVCHRPVGDRNMPCIFLASGSSQIFLMWLMFCGNEGHSSSSVVFSWIGRDDKSERAGESGGHAGLEVLN